MILQYVSNTGIQDSVWVFQQAVANWEVVCIICAKVCHFGHDVIYNGYIKTYNGCDCERRGPCKALAPRTSLPNPNNLEQEVTSAIQLLPRQGKYYIFDNNHNKCSSPK